MALVPLLDVAGAARWIRSVGPERLLDDLTAAMLHDFRRWPEFELVARQASHSPLGVIELMPTSDGTHYTFKYVNGHPSNPAHGLQTVTAFGVVADVATGYPVFVAEMTLLTALRTAATAALAARTLARPESSVMALVGAGSQSEFQALAVRAALGISTLRVHDVDPGASAKFARNLQPLGFTVTVARDAEHAVRGADVVTTCTADKRNAVVLSTVDPGTHVNALGGDCPGKTELARELVGRSRVFTEHTPQTRHEGEIQQVAADFPVTELWQVLTGASPGRTDADEVTLFDSVGFAVEDFCVLRFAQRSVLGTDLVIGIDLVADPEDPRDLFGGYLTPAPVRPG